MNLLTERIKLNLLFKVLYLSSNFAPTLGYLNPALNNCALSKNKSRHGWTNSKTETDCNIVVFEYWLA